tara:strand:- start:497 stop:700 length:204 start_codon:yes stop_codon:yes gene_type:complete
MAEYNKNQENKRNYNRNRRPPKLFKVKVYDTRKFAKQRTFIHEGLKFWEVDYLRFHPNLKVKILEVT